MPSSQVKPFSPTRHPTEFSAFGYLFGRFESLVPVEPGRKVKGQLCLKQGITLGASVAPKLWQKLTHSPKLGPEKAYLWRTYFRTDQEGKLDHLQLIKPLLLEGKTTLRHSPSGDQRVDLFRVSGRVEEFLEQAVVMRLERNHLPPPWKALRYEWQPFCLTLKGSLPEGASKEQFWELICRRAGEGLSIEQAHLVDETSIPAKTPSPFDKAKSTKAKSTKAKSTLAQTQPTQTQPQLPAVIMITSRKPEITVKFTERPDIPALGKKVILLLTEEGGVVVKAPLNRKTLKKQVEKMDSFADWVAALSGKIASVSPEGVIELEAASVNVFEKKQKVAQLEKSTENQTTENQTTAPQKASNQENSTPDPKPEPPEKTKQTFRLVK